MNGSLTADRHRVPNVGPAPRSPSGPVFGRPIAQCADAPDAPSPVSDRMYCDS